MKPSVPVWLAWTWVAVGVVGAMLALVGSVMGYRFVATTTEAAIESIDLSVEVLTTVGETTAVLDATFGDVADGLRAVQRTLIDSSVTLTQVAKVTDDLGELLGRDIPESIEAIRRTMPSLIATAGVVDGTMRALSFVGVDYDPETPFDDALVEIDGRLGEIPETLRGQEAVLADVADQLSAFGGQTLVMGDDLAGIRGRLVESESLLDRYAASADEARELLGGLRSDLVTQGRIGRWLVLGLGLAVAVGQTLPVAAGWWLLRSE